MAPATTPCASAGRCALGGTIILGTGSQAVRHRCRDCKQPIHGALCCGYHDEGSVFVCFPCHDKEQQTNDQSQSSTRTSTSSSSTNSDSTTTTTTTALRHNDRNKKPKTPFFKTGDLVDRNGNHAWVTESHPTPGRRHNLYNVKYVIDSRRESFGIAISGIKPTTLEPTGRRRGNGVVGVSLLSSSSARPAPLKNPIAQRRPVDSTVQTLTLKSQHWINSGLGWVE
jgi:hypothetical protein